MFSRCLQINEKKKSVNRKIVYEYAKNVLCVILVEQYLNSLFIGFFTLILDYIFSFMDYFAASVQLKVLILQD